MYANATGMVKCPKCQHCDDAANYLSPQNSTPVSDSEFETGLHTRPAGKSEQMLKPGILALIKGEYECSPDTVRLQRGVNTLGRSASSSHASIQLNTNDGYMSRMHASIDLIMKSDGTFVHNLADAGSNNGTWHNGEKLEKGDQILLKPGDVIKIGHTAFEFKLEE
jgi:pSer/pThr/pTyr-binding forkhead associated (FHA) protein